MKRKIFLSFAMEDKPDVDRVRKITEKEIPNVTFTDFSIRMSPGDDWQEKVDQFIRASDAIICVVGKRTHQSVPVAWEIKRGSELGKPIFVFLLENEIKLPPILDGISAIRRRWKSDEVRAALELVST